MRLFKRKLQKKGKKNKAPQCSPNRAVLEPLEPRLLLSADLAFQATAEANDLTLRMQKIEGVDTLQVVDTDNTDNVLASQALADTGAVVINGSATNDRLTVDLTNPFSTPISFAGGSGSDTLRIKGSDDRTWSITGTNTGSAENVTFSGVENLSGYPENDDTFIFCSGGSLSGTLAGGAAGSDTVDFAGVTADLTFTISGSGTVSVTDGTNTLTNVTGIENLFGGQGNNTFAFANGADFAGTVDGGQGVTNTLDYSAYTTAISVNLGADTPTATGVTGINNIQNVIGGSGSDTITGDDAVNILDGRAGNDRLTGGGGNDTLIGGTDNDRFVLADGGVHTIVEKAG
jgi:Ca2+-binding RTX toxin-like protein